MTLPYKVNEVKKEKWGSQWIGFIKGKPILCYICIGYIVGILIFHSIVGRTFIALPEPLSEAENGATLTVIGRVYEIQEKDYGQ